ncbi:MAG: penicillin-binding transpeptidase domain-containing protein, partial [bacterium]|nr:penicillin-binding transpeptidase domain-containing protein [bacterium]
QQAVINGISRYSKSLGYRGPIAHLEDQAKVDEFINKTQYELLDEEGLINYYDDPGLKKAMKQTPKLKPDRIYEAVLVNVDRPDLKLRVGNVEGTLAYKDWSWAKRPARKAKPWKPKIGDVVEVKLKTLKKKEGDSPVTLSKQFTLYQAPEVQSALFSYEPFSGKVKAVIGGQNYKKSEFNRATQALLQPGSSIKPLIYAAALDKGYSPGTVVMDSPIVYEESPGKFWSPRNYGGKYYGPTAFRHALVNSRNVVTVRILMDIGTHYVAGFMRKLGLSTPIYKYYSMALGSNEVKLAELATAYGTFVTGGIKPQTYYVEKILDPGGNVVEERKPQDVQYLISYKEVKDKENTDNDNQKPKKESEAQPESQPMGKKSDSWEEMGYNETLFEAAQTGTEEDDLLLTSYEKKTLYGDYIPPGYTITPKTAMTMVNILRDVVRAGTGARARALNKPAGGKTGTTNDATDAWFIGFTPTLVTGVWVGFDEERRTLGRGVTGGGMAAPIWLAYMKKATEHYPTKSFTVPKWVDLSVYEAPIGQVAVGDAELGDEGVGTGVVQAGPSGSSPSSTEFFVQDLE